MVWFGDFHEAGRPPVGSVDGDGGFDRADDAGAFEFEQRVYFVKSVFRV